MLINRCKTFFTRWWAQLIVVLIAAGILLIFKDQTIIAGGDSSYFLDFGNLLAKFVSTWYSKENLGVPNISLSQVFPTMLFWASLKFFGLPVWLIQRCWALVLSVGAGLSIFYLINYLFRRQTWPVKLGAIIGSTLYLYNMFIVIDPLQANYRPIHAVLPLLLLIWMKGLNKETIDYRLAIIFGLVSLLAAASYNNLAAASVIPIVLGLYFIYHLATKPRAWKRSLVFALAAGVNFLLFNIWWLITSLAFMLQVSGQTSTAVGNVSFVDSAKISDAFRFLGSWAFETTYNGLPLFPYSELYTTGGLVLTTLLIAVAVFAALLKRHLLRSTLFFAILGLAGMFLVKGTNPPWGEIFIWLQQLPHFWVFREPFAKFTPLVVLAFSVLLGLTTTMILSHLRQWRCGMKALVVAVLLMLILVNAFPLLTKQAVWDTENLSMKSMHAKVPDYWRDLSNWLRVHDSEARVFLLPRASYGHAYRWESGVSSAGHIAVPLLSNPVAGYPTAQVYPKDKVLTSLHSLLESQRPEQFARALSLAGFKYVLQQNDLEWQQGLMFKSPAPHVMKQQLEQVPGLELVRTFDKLDLYRVSEEYQSGQISITDRLIFSQAGIDQMLALAGFDNGALFSSFFLAEQMTSEEQSTVSAVATDFVVSVQTDDDSNSTFIDIPRGGTYQIAWRQTSNQDLMIDDAAINTRRAASPSADVTSHRLAHFSLLDPRSCAGDERLPRLRYFVPDYLPLDDSSTNKITASGQSLLPEEIDISNRTIDLCLDINLESAGVVKAWAPLSEESSATDLYESLLEEKFSDGLTTSQEDKSNLAAYLGARQLKAAFESPLTEPYSIDIGHIRPNRVVVMVPAGEVPDQDFQLYFIRRSGETSLPEVSLSAAEISVYRQTSEPVYLADGKHSIRFGRESNASATLVLTKPDYQHQPVAFSYQPRGLARWEVTIQEHEQPQILLLKDSFHSQWEARLNDQPLASHWTAVGYANAWLIPPGTDQRITISFVPERYLWLGVAVLMGYGGWSIFYLWRRRGALGLATTSLEIPEVSQWPIAAKFLALVEALVDFGYLCFISLIIAVVVTRWTHALQLSNQLAVVAFVLMIALVAIKLLTIGKKSQALSRISTIFFMRIASWFRHAIFWLVIKHWPVLIIAILGLASQLWIRDNLPLAGGDNFLYLNAGEMFGTYLNTAFLKFNGGLPNTVVNLLFPFLAFWKGLASLGLSIVDTQRIWLYLTFTLPGIAMYALIVNLSSRPMKIAGLLGGLLYMANIFIALDVLQITIKPIHALLPLIFLFWMKGLSAKRYWLYYALTFSLTSLFFASSSANIAVMGAPALILLTYTVYFLLTHRYQILSGLKFIGAALGSLVLVNLWWLIVSVPAMLALNEQVTTEVRRLGFEERTHLIEAFRLMGFWAFNTELAPSVPLLPYAREYYQWPLLLATFAIPIVAFLVFIFRRRLHALLIFFAALGLGGLFAIKGINEPLGSIFQSLRDHVTAFWIFREPFAKFMLIYLFALSILFGLSIQFLATAVHGITDKWKCWWGRRLYWLVPVVAIGWVAFAAYPIFTGQNIQDDTWYGNPRLSLRVKVPDYWNELSDWLSATDANSRVALFPKAGYGHSYYWNSGMTTGNYVADILLPNPTIRLPNVQSFTLTDKLATQLYDKVNQQDHAGFDQLLSILQVKYVLQQDDLAWDHAKEDTPSPEFMQAFLAADEKLQLVRTFGKLSLYEYRDYRPDAMVEAETGLDLVDAAGGEFGVQDRVISDYRPDRAVLVRNIYQPAQLNAIEDFMAEPASSRPTTISAEPISPTRWRVEVTGANDFLLTLKTTFLKDWRATVLPSDQSFSPWNETGRIADRRHLVTDGYANGWIVSPPVCVKTNKCGDTYQVIIDYYPQDVLYLGAIISGIALAGFIVLLIILRYRRTKVLARAELNHEDITGESALSD